MAEPCLVTEHSALPHELERLEPGHRSILSHEWDHDPSYRPFADQAWLDEAYEGKVILIQQLREIYMNQAVILIDKIQHSLDDQDRTALRLASHTLKGSLLAIGIRLPSVALLETLAYNGRMDVLAAIWRVAALSLEKIAHEIRSQAQQL